MSDWIDSTEKLPKNCQPVYAKRLVRYKLYKPQSQQFKRGIKGRWQEFNGYGWDNCEPPVEWLNPEEQA